MRLVFVLSLALVSGAVASGSAQLSTPGQTATEFAQTLQRRYDRIKDFSANFIHSYRGGVLRREAIERGVLLVKRPGKMRWEYKTPEAKLFVSDGTVLYSYLPQDKQVLVSTLPSDEAAPTPALFLAGKGNLTRDFDVSYSSPLEGAQLGSRALKLVAKTPQQDYEYLILTVDEQTLTLRGLVAIDTQGGTSSFSFTNLKENVGLSDTLFLFDIPRGVEVIKDSAR
jgi:outer membrane lipoprotein carrier protein